MLMELRSLFELKATLSNKKYLNFIGLKRSELDKCNQCEFNIVCTNPFYNRECNDDLYSAPNNCHYDPKLLIWK